MNSDCSSRSPTPRFIVDRQGEIRWPPIKMNDTDALDNIDNDNDAAADDNFTLKNPQDMTDSSPDAAPCVLGWLQVQLNYLTVVLLPLKCLFFKKMFFFPFSGQY